VKRTPLVRKSWLKRGTKPLPPVNRARKAKNTLRAYGSKQRRDFVTGLPCLICGTTPSEQAHAPHPSSGTSHKADAEAVVPLCHFHHIEELHRIGVASFEAKYREELRCQTLAWHAERTDRLWRARIGGGAS
jgi:hypothetical protein